MALMFAALRRGAKTIKLRGRGRPSWREEGAEEEEEEVVSFSKTRKRKKLRSLVSFVC
jgi:hypothetical protein